MVRWEGRFTVQLWRGRNGINESFENNRVTYSPLHEEASLGYTLTDVPKTMLALCCFGSSNWLWLDWELECSKPGRGLLPDLEDWELNYTGLLDSWINQRKMITGTKQRHLAHLKVSRQTGDEGPLWTGQRSKLMPDWTFTHRLSLFCGESSFCQVKEAKALLMDPAVNWSVS